MLDLTRVWAGPLATRIMGDFGAEVIKISDPRVPLDRLSGTNNKLNRNKVNLALRLDHEEGRELFLELGGDVGRGGRELPSEGDAQLRSDVRAAAGGAT